MRRPEPKTRPDKSAHARIVDGKLPQQRAELDAWYDSSDKVMQHGAHHKRDQRGGQDRQQTPRQVDGGNRHHADGHGGGLQNLRPGENQQPVDVGGQTQQWRQLRTDNQQRDAIHETTDYRIGHVLDDAAEAEHAQQQLKGARHQQADRRQRDDGGGIDHQARLLAEFDGMVCQRRDHRGIDHRKWRLGTGNMDSGAAHKRGGRTANDGGENAQRGSGAEELRPQNRKRDQTVADRLRDGRDGHGKCARQITLQAGSNHLVMGLRGCS